MREYVESTSVRDSVKSMYDFFDPTSRKIHSCFVAIALILFSDSDSSAPISNAIDGCLLLIFFKTFKSLGVFRNGFTRTSDFGDLLSSLSDFVWFRMHDDSSCLYKYDFSANALPHLAQLCGFVLECVWMCARRFDLSANDFEQIEHWKGFSPANENKRKNYVYFESKMYRINGCPKSIPPVCVRMWPCRSHGRENLFPQCGHSQPWLCVRTCIEYAGIETYTLSQCGHRRAFLSNSERCVCRWRARLDEVEYFLPHSGQLWTSSDPLMHSIDLLLE